MDATTLADRKRQLGYLQEEAEQLREKMMRLHAEIIAAEARFKPGDIVTYKRGGRRWTGTIDMIAGLTCNHTVYRVTPTLTSGKVGIPVHITDWQYDDIKPVEPLPAS